MRSVITPVGIVLVQAVKYDGCFEAMPLKTLFIVFLASTLYGSSFCLFLLQKASHEKFDLGIGDRIKILNSEGRDSTGVYLGWKEDSHHRNTFYHYVYQEESGRVLRYEHDKIDLNLPVNSKKDSIAVQSLPSIACQRGGDCAAHSTFNTLAYLDDLNYLIPTLTKNRIVVNGPKLRRQIFNTDINADYRALTTTDFFSLFKKAPQSELQRKQFEDLGFKAEDTTNLEKIDQHLSQSLPVVMNLLVAEGPEQKVYEGKELAESRETFRPKWWNAHGKHSVLVIKSFLGGDGRKKILVLDSAIGDFCIWDLKDTTWALKNAILVSPQ